MTLTFSSFSLFDLILLLRGSAAAPPSSRPAPLPGAEEARADRAFLHEMMQRHPEAIQSEQGMMMLMALYPRQI